MGENDESLLKAIKHYQNNLERYSEQKREDRMLHCIERLTRLPIKMTHLETTGVGRTVNSLRKLEGKVGESAKHLITQWKKMVVKEQEQQQQEEEEEEEEVEEEDEEAEVENAVEDMEEDQGIGESNDEEDDDDKEEERPKEKIEDKRRSSHNKSMTSKDKHEEKEKHSSHHKHKSRRKSAELNQSDDDGNHKRKHNKHKSSKRENEENERYKESGNSSNSNSKHKSKKKYDSDIEKEEKNYKENNSKQKSKRRHDSDKSDEEQEDIPKSKKKHYESEEEHRNKGKKKNKNVDKKHRSKDENKEEKQRKESNNSNSSSNKHKKSKETDKKEHKESKSTSKSKTDHKDKSNRPKIKCMENGIDSGSGASFAEALGMCAPSTSKSVPKVKKPHPEKREKSPVKEKRIIFEESIPKPSIEPVDINISSLLPPITPNYRPLGNIFTLDNVNKQKATDFEQLSSIITSKNQRTKVYSGNKNSLGRVPSLFEMCVRILQDNIDALEYTGGVPYLILKPILEKATPNQLFVMEHHNPYLIEETDELWQLHCNRDFKSKHREEMESWREMYMRCLDEREAKLKALTANIKQAQDKSLPVRTTKLAYVDDVAKPPRNIARKQAKNGTAFVKKPALTPSARLSSLATSGEAGKVSVPNPGARAAERSSNHSQVKPKKAPLMAKSLSLLKNRFRR